MRSLVALIVTTAMTIAACGEDGTPDARIVVLSPVDLAPIYAKFDEQSSTTIYFMETYGRTEDGDVRWSGPNCGTWRDAGKTRFEDEKDRDVWEHAFVWSHPHPACPHVKDHADVTIRVRVATLSATHEAECSYTGSATGEGQPCMTVPRER